MGWVSTERSHDEQPITVGVIDDDPMICQMMRLILEDYSSGRISVAFACTNAADAIEHASHNPPDVVLADIAMPGMDGIEATRQLRMLPDPPHVLILTSLSPNNTVERAIEAGAEGFVSKTDAPEDIIRRVADVCEGEPQFNPASQRQLIGDLHQHQPQSRRDEAPCHARRLAGTRTRSGDSRGRGLHQCGNQRENVHFRTHGQSAYFIRRR